MALAAKDISTLAQTEAQKVETKPNGTIEKDQEQEIQQGKLPSLVYRPILSK